MNADLIERRREVARLRALGRSQRSIATELMVSQATVRYDLAHLPESLNGEREAIAAEARKRLSELRNVRAILWPDRDDPMVLSELCVVQSCIRHAEQALRELEADG